MPRRAMSYGPPHRSRRLAIRIVPSARLDRLFDLGGGILLHPFVRRQDEGRALARGPRAGGGAAVGAGASVGVADAASLGW